MIFFRMVIALTAFAFSAPLCLAQSGVGTAIVDGKRVTLYSDFSWRYFEAEPAGCTEITRNLNFCADSRGWERLENPGPEIAAMYLDGSDQYLLFIEDQVGISGGLTLEFMTNAVLDNASDGAGRNAVPVLSVEDFEYRDRPARQLAYIAIVDGLEFLFFNTIILAESYTIQVITYKLGDQSQAAARTAHEAARKTIELK